MICSKAAPPATKTVPTASQHDEIRRQHEFINQAAQSSTDGTVRASFSSGAMRPGSIEQYGVSSSSSTSGGSVPSHAPSYPPPPHCRTYLDDRHAGISRHSHRNGHVVRVSPKSPSHMRRSRQLPPIKHLVPQPAASASQCARNMPSPVESEARARVHHSANVPHAEPVLSIMSTIM